MDGRTDIPRMRAIARLFVKKREKERKKKGEIFSNRTVFISLHRFCYRLRRVSSVDRGEEGEGEVCKRAGEGEGNRITKKKSAFFMRGFYYAVHGALSAPCGVSQIALWFIR